MWWFRAWKGFSYWCLFVFVSAEVCSPQLGLCSHGDGCEGLWESNLQEVIAAGWSICSMRMAPEGRIVDVQLAICCGPADRARKLSPHPLPSSENTQKDWHFQIPGPGTALAAPREFLSTSQTLSFRHSQWEFQKTSSSGVMTPCGAFIGVQNESGSGHSMAHSSAKDHYSSLSLAKSLGFSTLLQTGKPLPDQVTGGLS